MKKRIMACFLAGIMLIGMLGGCGDSGSDDKTTAAQTQGQETTAGAEDNTTTEADKNTVVYPMEGNPKLTLAMVSEEPVTLAGYESLGDTPVGKAWAEKTGVDLEIIYLASHEAMSLLINGGELPDIIYWNFSKYSGGLFGALNDGLAIALNDYAEFCPDYIARLEEHEFFARAAYAEDGQLAGFSQINPVDERKQTFGFIVRQDWLDELKLDVPETADEFYNMLKAFKDEKGVKYPFAITNSWLKAQLLEKGIITSAFGLATTDFYQVDGTVHYGYAEQEYKDVLTWLKKLYDEELLDPAFQTIDQNTVNANMLNGDAGVTAGNLGGNMGTYLDNMKDDPSYKLAGIQPLVANEGDIAMTGGGGYPGTSWFAIVTSDCKDVETAVKFLNYGYSEEGQLLANAGIEGVSYEMVDGKPVFTDMILNNPDGLTKQSAKAVYTLYWNATLSVVNNELNAQYSTTYESQVEAQERWSKNEKTKYVMPPVTIPAEYVDEYNAIKADITTYIGEMCVSYITGLKSLDDFESEYLATLKQVKVDRLIEIQQLALDAYNAK